MKADDEPIGYGRPPREHRFKKGVSGNPTGRPRMTVPEGPAEHDILRKVISRKINIAVNGRTRRVLIKEAIALQLVEKAAKGDFRAMKEVMAVAAVSEGRRELPAGYEAGLERLVKRISNLSYMEEGLVQAGLLYPGADTNMYFKRSVFEHAVAGTGSRATRSSIRLTTPEIEASKGKIAYECVFEMFARIIEILAQRTE
jgi:hypothetical protein